MKKIVATALFSGMMLTGGVAYATPSPLPGCEASNNTPKKCDETTNNGGNGGSSSSNSGSVSSSNSSSAAVATVVSTNTNTNVVQVAPNITVTNVIVTQTTAAKDTGKVLKKKITTTKYRYCWFVKKVYKKGKKVKTVKYKKLVSKKTSTRYIYK